MLIENNPLETRADVQNAVNSLLRSTEDSFSSGRARVRLGINTAYYPQLSADCEGYTRLLWGLAPLLAGGGRYGKLSFFIEGLSNGTDPVHPEFWGCPNNYDSRLVEATAIAYALILAPNHFWSSLGAREKQNVSTWLTDSTKKKFWDNNWLFFRVIINLALKLIDKPYDESEMRKDLDRLESFHQDDGWYRDGPSGPCDYYNSFAMHFYGLIYARFADSGDRERADRLRNRALEFAEQFMGWFSEDGSAIPYGRSLVYRFGQAALWSAFPLSETPFRSWGVVKGMLLRHLRWWLRQPIYEKGGTLALGYGYDNPIILEQYVSPSSPYWALKSFAMLAVPEEHPFWHACEEGIPQIAESSLQRSPRMIVCRDQNHVFALAGGQTAHSRPKSGAEKYSKFCYSNLFGFSVPSDSLSLELLAPDSTLLLSDDHEWWRSRRDPKIIELTKSYIRTDWQPWPSVVVSTWLAPFVPWHIRVHLLKTDIPLYSAEGGFAINRDFGTVPASTRVDGEKIVAASAECGESVSIIQDLLNIRSPSVLRTSPNTNILFARALLPTLQHKYAPGEHWLVSCVAGWQNKNSKSFRATSGLGCLIREGKSLSIYDENKADILKITLECDDQ